MSTDYYTFKERYAVGDKHEKFLDEFFSNWYAIRGVSLQAQKWGIDRIFTNRVDKKTWTVEYKSDEISHRTGNIFVEIVSVDTEHKPGWAYSSCAQLLAYYIVGESKVCMALMTNIKIKAEEWKQKYRTVEVKNNGYNTVGILVPLEVFRENCYAVLDTRPVEQ
jgi:hypothetical protein